MRDYRGEISLGPDHLVKKVDGGSLLQRDGLVFLRVKTGLLPFFLFLVSGFCPMAVSILLHHFEIIVGGIR